MPESTELEEPSVHAASQARKDSGKDSEYVRLVISSEPRVVDSDNLEPQPAQGTRSSKWWIKLIIWCVITVIASLIFLKWGVPFLFEKVIIYYWLYTIFSLPSYEFPMDVARRFLDC